MDRAVSSSKIRGSSFGRFSLPIHVSSSFWLLDIFYGPYSGGFKRTSSSRAIS